MHNWKTLIAAILLPVLGVAAGFAISEIGYRALLRVKLPQHFGELKPAEGYFSLYDKTLWEFDKDFGYRYPPGRVIHYTGIQNGAVRDCFPIDVVNARGNIGPITGSYEDADLKILLFGDSWAAFNLDNKTWPFFLQKELEERLDRSVHVVNFGRDAYGVLQMMDFAAAMIPEWKPDLALFTFITDDLQRARFWRAPIFVNGESRVLTVVEPESEPDLRDGVDTFMLAHEATLEWCKSMQGKTEPDRVLKKILERQAKLQTPGNQLLFNIYTFEKSFLLDRVLHGNPFHDPFSGSPTFLSQLHLQISDYAQDSEFLGSLDAVEKSGVPFIPVHLAFFPEIKDGVEYITNDKQERLLESLERELGQEVLKTTDYIDLPMDRPERMNASETNYHPSLWGMQFYARVVADMLEQNGHLDAPDDGR